MKLLTLTGGIAALSLFSFLGKAQNNDQLVPRDNWAIQSSAKVTAGGKVISKVNWKPENWYPTTVPATVLATLVDNKVFPDPYYGTNIEKLPGYFKNAVKKDMPENSPFRVPWWYRTTFKLPLSYKGKHVWLKFHSINYKANIWLNGNLIADSNKIQGAYRLFDLDKPSMLYLELTIVWLWRYIHPNGEI
jgi:exo-1,4-beta-D-glucosaminidase